MGEAHAHPYVNRLILSDEEKDRLDVDGVITIERGDLYKDEFGDVRQETKVYFLYRTSKGWKRVGYGTATLTTQSRGGKHLYRIVLEKVPSGE